jgi:integrase
VAEEFIDNYLPRLRSRKVVEALIRRELIPILGDKPIGEIRRRDIIALIENIKSRGKVFPGKRRTTSGGTYAARHAFAQLSKFFNWAVARDIEGLESSPCSGVKVSDLLGASQPRSRVLTETEIRAVWEAFTNMGWPFGDAFRLLLLTGQRLREIAEAQWNEVDFEQAILTIPAERMKANAEHIVPLSAAAMALLRGVPRFAGGGFIFSATAGRKPVSGFSKATNQARQLAGILGHWQLHDLRRTVRTRLSELGVSPFTAELVMAHTQTGVHGVYDLHKYDAEKRDALIKWEARLLSIVAPPNNVVAMPVRA